MQGILIKGDNPGDNSGLWCFDNDFNFLGVLRQSDNPILHLKWGHIHNQNHKTLTTHQHDIFFTLLEGGYASDEDIDTAIEFLKDVLKD